MVNIEKFHKFYDYKVEGRKLILIKNGKESYVRSTPIYLTYEYKPSSVEEAEILVSEGKIDKTNAEELYKLLLNYNDDTIKELQQGLDIRSINYIEAQETSIGLVDTEIDGKEYSDDSLCSISTYSIFKEDDKYIAQHGVFCPPDDYFLHKIIFDRMPTELSIQTYNMLEDLQIELRSIYNSEQNTCSYKCHNCGDVVHWLDVEGSLQVKLNSLKNRCCCK